MLTQTIAISQYDQETDADKNKDKTNVEEKLLYLKPSGRNSEDVLNCRTVSF